MAIKASTGAKSGKGSKVLRCDCVHAYQDKVFGVGRRSHNECNGGMRCTVCKTKRGD